MARSLKAWMLDPAKQVKSSPPATLKAEVEGKAKELIETVLKPRYVMPPPKEEHFNYLIDIGTKWHGSYFYFIATYACPGPNAIAPTFETKFGRMEYASDGKFNLAFMRYTEQWVVLHAGLSVDQCMSSIRDDPWFQP